jgi:hypothetical protein
VKVKVTFQTRSRIENCILFPFGFVGGIRWVPSPSDKRRNTNSVAIRQAEKQLSFLFMVVLKPVESVPKPAENCGAAAVLSRFSVIWNRTLNGHWTPL